MDYIAVALTYLSFQVMTTQSLTPIDVLYWVDMDVPYRADKITNSPNYEIGLVNGKIKSITIKGIIATSREEAMHKGEPELERILGIICLGTNIVPIYKFSAAFPWDKGGLAPAIGQVRGLVVPVTGEEPIDLNKYESKKSSPELQAFNMYYISRYLLHQKFVVEAYLNLILTLERLQPDYKGMTEFQDYVLLRDTIVHVTVTHQDTEAFARRVFSTNSVDWRDANNINIVRTYYTNLEREVKIRLKALL